MSLAIALSARDGLVVACARAGEVAPLRVVGDRAGANWRTFVRPLGGIVVCGSARLGASRDLEASIAAWEGTEGRRTSFPDVVEALRGVVVDVSARETGRHAAWEDRPGAHAPSSSLLVAGMDGGPRLTHVSAAGDVEDRSETGYDALGAGELYAHVLLPWFHDPGADSRAAAVAAYAVVADAELCGVFGVEAPPRLWKVQAGRGEVRELDAVPVGAAVQALRARLRAAVAEAAP